MSKVITYIFFGSITKKILLYVDLYFFLHVLKYSLLNYGFENKAIIYHYHLFVIGVPSSFQVLTQIIL
jgi:hypothetical protein